VKLGSSLQRETLKRYNGLTGYSNLDGAALARPLLKFTGNFPFHS
jgi:hypothetical protein